MTKDTSIEAFKKIIASGLLTEMEEIVYQILYLRGPATAKEVSESVKDKIPATSISPIFARLKRNEVVKITGKRACTVTGSMVYEWSVTDTIPPKKSAREKSADLVRSRFETYKQARISYLKSLEQHRKKFPK